MWRPTRHELVPSSGYYRQAVRSLNGALLYAAPGSLVTVPERTRSFETLYSESGADRKEFRNCEHYRKTVFVPLETLSGLRTWYNAQHTLGYWVWNPLPLEMAWDDTAALTSSLSPRLTYGKLDTPFEGLPALYVDSTDQGRYVPDPEGLQNLIEDSLKEMLPGIRPSLSLLNSIYELKDFKGMARSVLRMRKSLSSLKAASAYAKLFLGARKGHSLTPRDLLRSASQGYLQWSFAIAPLLSDIKAVQAAMKDVVRQLNWLKSNAGKRLTVHYRRPLTKLYGNSSEEVSLTRESYVANSSLGASREVSYSACSFNATLDYDFAVYNLSPFSDETAALLDAFGVNLNPAILWNALPWSFVVDWIAQVGGWLDQFKLRALEPVTTVHQYCWSYSVSRRVVVGYGWDAVQPVAATEERAYKRRVLRPTGSRTLRWSGLNLKEFSLAAALGLSRR